MISMTIRNCEWCNKEFQVKTTIIKNRPGCGRFCSKSCVNFDRWKKLNPEEIFKRNIIYPENLNDCWIYKILTGSKNKKDNRHLPYGYINFKGRHIGAHRFSYMFHFGEIPQGMMVLHRCDNASCVNPSHLFLGTALDNMQDKNKKGRGIYVKGSQIISSILNEDDVKKIKLRIKNNESDQSISKDYKVGSQQIGKIRRNKAWLHVKI